MKMIKYLTLSMTVLVFTISALVAATEDKKSKDVKVEKEATGLKSLFPNGTAGATVKGIYNNKSAHFGLNENVKYRYEFNLGSSFAEKKLSTYLSLRMVQQHTSRETEIDNIFWENSFKPYKSDYVSTDITTWTSFPTGSNTHAKTNLFFNVGLTHKDKIATEVGDIKLSLKSSFRTDLQSSKAYEDEEEEETDETKTEANLVADDTTTSTGPEEKRPIDFRLEVGPDLKYTTSLFKGFSSVFSYRYRQTSVPGDEVGKSHMFINTTTVPVTKKLSVVNYLELVTDVSTKTFSDSFEKGGEGIYNELAVKYKF